MKDEDHKKAHTYVLLNCKEVEEYVLEFDAIAGELYSGDEVSSVRDEHFAKWFEQRVNTGLSNGSTQHLLILANGPSKFVQSLNGYFVNGYKFHTRKYGEERVTSNHGEHGFLQFDERLKLPHEVTRSEQMCLVTDIIAMEEMGLYRMSGSRGSRRSRGSRGDVDVSHYQETDRACDNYVTLRVLLRVMTLVNHEDDEQELGDKDGNEDHDDDDDDDIDNHDMHDWIFGDNTSHASHRPFISRIGDGFASSEIHRSIGRVLREHLSGPWTTYRKVPQKVVVAMFKRFKVWNTEEWRKKSMSGKDNRSKTDGSGKISRHTGGSIGYDERSLILRVKLGKEPTFLELFLDTHLNKRCKKRLWAVELNVKILDGLQFCTERAKEAYAEYLEEMTKEHGLNFTQDDARIWERLHGNGGPKRVFGIGSSDLSFVVTGTSSSSYGSTPSFVDQQAQQRELVNTSEVNIIFQGSISHGLTIDAQTATKRHVDGLGGLGATVVNALDTAMIMKLDGVVYEADSWIENHLPERISHKVMLFCMITHHMLHLMDLSSTSEASTLQLEFNYLSYLNSEPKYGFEVVKVLEHMKTLPKVEGLVPIYISPSSGEFSGAMKDVKHLLVKNLKPNGLVFVRKLPSGIDGGFSPEMDHHYLSLQYNFTCLGVLLAWNAHTCSHQRHYQDNGRDLLTFEDLENLKLAEDLAKTYFEMYAVTSTGLAPEIAYFSFEVYMVLFAMLM
ncbi:hypothetical protein E3N88_36742 [Mikania micrantha]|uniref:mannosyl-oligosaccharide 1,2-alpha-mannosidase n=1 Tax=Mikania micrantha TaxID=192012 RepID=A0A5N6M531_9ASTR|nr:hypothetical protein E3N88_36742 [Mikania micrantha]